MNQILKQEVLALLKPEQMVYLSTSIDNQPKVRPVTLIYNKNRFFFATGANDAKVQQISSNPQVEICLTIKNETNSGYVRAGGILELISDSSIRKEIYEEASFLHYFWKAPTDPSYVLYQMNWHTVEYMKPGETLATKFDW
jgi:general stress protein 26